jgi:hypothetical protein|tara:strand:+ start:955 stop:3429 length:2475 start_codon:yes stop_codon:yes gene_type:complete
MVETVTNPETIKKFEEIESNLTDSNVVTDEETLRKFENLESQDKGILNALKKAGIATYDFFEGSKRTQFPEVKEFSGIGGAIPGKDMTAGQAAKIGAGFFFTPVQEEMINIIKAQIPGVEILKDAYNNPMIVMPDGKAFYLNKPGASMADFSMLLSQTLQYLPGASWALKPGRGTVNKILLSGVAGSATSYAQDVAAMQFGAKDTYPIKAAISALVPMGFEGAISPAFRVVVKKLFGNPKFTELVNGKIQLNTKGKQALKTAGIDLKDVESAQWIDSFALSLSRGVDPSTAAKVAGAEQYGIRLFPAQTSDDPMALAYFWQAAEGKHGAETQKLVTEYLKQQELQIGDVTSTFLHRIAMGNMKFNEINKEFPDLAEAIIKRHHQSSENVKTAYNAINKDGVFTGGKSNIDLLELNVLGALDEADMLFKGTIDKELHPIGWKALDIIRNFTKSIDRKDTIVFDNVPITFTNKTYRDFNKVYKQLQGLFGKNLDPADKKVLTLIKNEYDKFIDDSLSNLLFTAADGTNATSLEVVKNASKLSKEHFDLFGNRMNKDFATRQIQKILNDPDITPDNTLNLLFNLNSVGKRSQSLEIIKKLKKIHGVEDFGDAMLSPDFMAIRDAFLKKMIFDATKKTGAKTGFDPVKLVTDWEIMLLKNPRVIQELFSTKDIKQITEFTKAVRKTFKPSDLTKATAVADGIVANIRQFLRGIVGMGGYTLAAMHGLLVSRSGFDTAADYYTKKAALKLVDFGSAKGRTFPASQAFVTGGTNIDIGEAVDSPNIVDALPFPEAVSYIPDFAYNQQQRNERKFMDPLYIQTIQKLGLLD